jgi:multidrug resistance efflux pump
MKKKLVVVTLVAAASGAFYAFRWRGASKDLLAAGTIEAREVQVGSLVGGRVQTVHVEEGRRVGAGDALVTLEPELLDAQIAEQEGRVAEQRALLSRAVQGPRAEEVSRARVEWENAEADRKRTESLLRDGVVGQQQYDSAATLAATRRERLREYEKGTRPEDVAAARGELQREEGRLAYLRRQREEAVVRAPAESLVQSIDLRPGDLVPPHQPVAALLESSQLWVRVYVPEPKLGAVTIGQRALVAVDTFPTRRFEGEVTEISARAEYMPRNVQTLDQRSEQVFGVKVRVLPVPELKPGMAALVTLLSADR